MSVEQMREIITKLYSSQTWKNRVDKMADNQVIAIYHSYLAKNRLG